MSLNDQAKFISKVGILCACLVSMLQLRNVPGCAVYISVITQVTKKSVKILAVFIPMFIAFSLVFQIIVRQVRLELSYLSI